MEAAAITYVLTAQEAQVAVADKLKGNVALSLTLQKIYYLKSPRLTRAF